MASWRMAGIRAAGRASSDLCGVSGSADGDGQVRGGDAFGAGEDQAERKERIEAVWRCRIPTIPGKSNPALSSKSEPVYVRLPPRFTAIRASGEGLPPPSSWRSKIRYRGIRAPPGVESKRQSNPSVPASPFVMQWKGGRANTDSRGSAPPESRGSRAVGGRIRSQRAEPG